MGKINKSRLLRILAIATVLTAVSVAFAFADDPTDITGYHLVYKPLYEYIDTFLQPVVILLSAVGSVYAIALGVKYAKAEEPQEREKVKVAIKNLIKGFIAVFVIYAVWQVLMARVIVPFAVDQTKELDDDWETVTSTGSEYDYGYGIYQNSAYEPSIKESRQAASDANASGPKSTETERDDSEDLGQPDEAQNPSFDPNTSNTQQNADGTETSIDDKVETSDLINNYISQVRTAMAALKNASEDGFSAAKDALQAAVDNLKEAMSQYGTTEEGQKAVSDAESYIAEANELMS